MTRPTWNNYFHNIAVAVAERSDCERDKVGAVVVKDRRIRSTGYNGAPAGQPGCGTCPRRTSQTPKGEGYENCVALHAEQNAIIYCDREDLQNATIYITRKPCDTCMKLIMGSGIESVVYPT
jgi:dCMP deaminase